MSEIALLPEERIGARIARDGFVFVEAAAMESALARAGSLADWPAFAASWEGLELDTYMADGGRYRRRRHAVYGAGGEGAILRRPHQPHYQSRDYNPLNGGVARWFAPIEPEIGEGPSMRAILGFCSTLFGSLAPATSTWHIEAHQFRIEARLGEEGRPTPEGLHRDGVDYVLVLLIGRRNIKRGTTTIHDLGRRLLGSFTLAHPFDAALVDDARVYHGVTPVEPLDPALPAYRDVLVVTFRAADAQKSGR
ncbi:MAG: 2OG-Fe dioxygenase family protein [Alphaproteobacteria bacterium]